MTSNTAVAVESILFCKRSLRMSSTGRLEIPEIIIFFADLLRHDSISVDIHHRRLVSGHSFWTMGPRKSTVTRRTTIPGKQLSWPKEASSDETDGSSIQFRVRIESSSIKKRGIPAPLAGFLLPDWDRNSNCFPDSTESRSVNESIETWSRERETTSRTSSRQPDIQIIPKRSFSRTVIADRNMDSAVFRKLPPQG